MSKMHYFSNTFSKIAKPKIKNSPLTFNFGDLWSSVIWSNCVFSSWLWHHFSDVINITSPKNVTKITSQFFPIWAPPNQLRQWKALRDCFYLWVVRLLVTIGAAMGGGAQCNFGHFFKSPRSA